MRGERSSQERSEVPDRLPAPCSRRGARLRPAFISPRKKSDFWGAHSPTPPVAAEKKRPPLL